MENIESSQNRIDILLSQGGHDINDVEDLNESQIRGSPSYCLKTMRIFKLIFYFLLIWDLKKR
jgi:hypothetical protein